MKKLLSAAIFLLSISLYSCSDKEGNASSYELTVVSDLSASCYIDGAGPKITIDKTPYTKTFSQPSDNHVKLNIAYSNTNGGPTKQLSATLKKDGQVLQTKSGVGQVIIEYVP